MSNYPLHLSRVVAPGAEKSIGSHNFTNWGAHHDSYPTAYFTAAAAIGMKREEVDIFAKRLEKTFSKFHSKRKADGAPQDSHKL